MNAENAKKIDTVWFVGNTDGAIYRFRNSLLHKLTKDYNVETFCDISPEGSYESALREIGCGYNRLSFIFDIRIIMSVMILAKSLLLKRPKVALVYTIPAILVFAVATYFAPVKVKKIGTVTGLGRNFAQEINTRSWKIALLCRFMKILFSRMDHIIFQNNEDRDFCISQKIVSVENSSVVSGSGVDLDRIRPSYDNLHKQMYKYLFLGRGLKEKGILAFYDVAETFRGSDREFIHAGYIDPSLKNDIEDFDDFSSKSNVKYVGFVHNILEIMDKVDAIIAPSIYREGIPRSLIEAIALDKYIITCNTVGNKEVVVDGYNGRFVKFGDIDDLRKAILEYEDLKKDEFVGRSRALAEARFDVEKIDKHIVCLISA